MITLFSFDPGTFYFGCFVAVATSVIKASLPSCADSLFRLLLLGASDRGFRISIHQGDLSLNSSSELKLKCRSFYVSRTINRPFYTVP